MELAFSMPARFKIRNGWWRCWVLKQAMKGPAGRHPGAEEGGPAHPDENWLRRELQPLMRTSPVNGSRPSARPVRSQEVSRLVEDHVTGHENHAHTLFPLMVFERWATEHLSRNRPSSSRQPVKRFDIREFGEPARLVPPAFGGHDVRGLRTASRPGWPADSASVRRMRASARVRAISSRAA